MKPGPETAVTGGIQWTWCVAVPLKIIYLKKKMDYPGGPVVKTLCFLAGALD